MKTISYIGLLPLQNPTLGGLVAEGGNILWRQTGLWSTETMVWGIVSKAAWHWGGDSSVANDPFGAPGSTPSYVCLTPSWGSADGDCLIPRLLWDYYGPQGKYKKEMAKAEFKFRRLSNIFMEPSHYDEIPLSEILYSVWGTGWWWSTADGDAR
jgi:hypothetical protein